MLESFNTTNEMEYQRLSAEEQTRRGILGRLVGVIADFKEATRNGRRYKEELWDKTFSDPLTREKLESRCIFGELGHPADRQEIDMEKVAICLAEMPKKGNDGKLYGVFDILATPNGRILKTLCDYGCKIGVSSRGGGDTFEDYDGGETVDSDTYEFECFDAVLVPAVKAARPKYVTESLNTRKTLHEALQQTLADASAEDKRVMQETLSELQLDDSDEESDTPITTEAVDSVTENIDGNSDVDSAADDIGAKLTAELQEALKKQNELEIQVKELQEKLSVCYTKESRYSTKLDNTLAQLALSESKHSNLVKQIESLKQESESKDVTIASLNEKLTRTKTVSTRTSQGLNEQLNSKTSEVKKLQESIKTITSNYESKLSDCNAKLNEAYETQTSMKKQNDSLVEEVATLKKDSQIYKSQSAAKLERSEKLTEKYKTVAKTAVDKYLNLQATRLGVSLGEVKKRLGESYSFNDIDRVCEELQKYKVTMNSLPFIQQGHATQKVRGKITESVDPIVKMNDASFGLDDDIDAGWMDIISK